MDVAETALPLNSRVLLNIGGTRYETLAGTLMRIPSTRLAAIVVLGKDDEAYDPTRGEYFFDRHPGVFECILNYYRCGELHLSNGLCGNVVKSELDFWGFEEQEIEACCWNDYSRYTSHKGALVDLDNNVFAPGETAAFAGLSGCVLWKVRVWRFLEEPGAYPAAKGYAVVSMGFVTLSIAIFVLETHKLFQVDEKSGISMMTLLPDDDKNPRSCCCTPPGDRLAKNDTASLYTPVTHPIMLHLDYACVIFFILEILLRFITCPNKLRFIRKPLNVIDFICLLPHLVSIILKSLSRNTKTAYIIKSVMVLRTLRILRIFKLMKHYGAFKVLVYTIKVSTKELLLVVVFLVLGVLMFASTIHFVDNANFPNIPLGIWWAVVTMTTVGYGDIIPSGYAGYMMGSVCVICGVLVIAFTVPIVVNNFSLYYSYAQSRSRLPHRRNFNVELASQTNGRAVIRQSWMNGAPGTTVANRFRQTALKTLMKHHDRSGQSSVSPAKETTLTTLQDVEGSSEHHISWISTETTKIMGIMAETDHKFSTERLRQAALLKEKRDDRALHWKQKKNIEETSQPITGNTKSREHSATRERGEEIGTVVDQLVDIQPSKKLESE